MTLLSTKSNRQPVSVVPVPQGVSIELSFAFTLETYPPEEEIIAEEDESNKLYVLKQGIVICRVRPVQA